MANAAQFEFGFCAFERETKIFTPFSLLQCRFRFLILYGPGPLTFRSFLKKINKYISQSAYESRTQDGLNRKNTTGHNFGPNLTNPAMYVIYIYIT